MDNKLKTEDQLVVDALKEAGVRVASVQDLLIKRELYPEAVPVLLGMLERVESYAIREIIVRSLIVKGARGVVEPVLLHQFESSLADASADAQSFRWAIANTLDSIGGKSDVETLVRLLRDPRSARSRGLLSVAAAKTKDRRVVPILLDYLDSEGLQGFAARGLGLMRAKEAVPKLKIVAAKTSNSWVRREALNALHKLGADGEAVN